MYGKMGKISQQEQALSNLKEQFGKYLKALRVQRQMTQEQLAEDSHISVDFLSLIERGRNAPSFGILERLAEALDVPVKALFDFDEDGRNNS